MNQALAASHANNDLLSELIDRMAITKVVQDWALFRDTGRWDRLRALYSSDGIMFTTWFAGSANEFVERSIKAAGKEVRGQHFMGAVSIDINGDRAIAESRMILLGRVVIGTLEVDVTCFGRFYDLFIRQTGAWRIKKRVPIYEKDRMDSVNSNPIAIDADKLASYPEGYRHVAYVQSLGGATLTPGLPTPNSQELKLLYAEGSQWLDEA